MGTYRLKVSWAISLIWVPVGPQLSLLVAKKMNRQALIGVALND